MLPADYQTRKVRLVISCHGAGGTVTTNDSQVEQQTLTKYLVANGYAVMDVGGLPKEFCLKYGVDAKNNVGCHIAVDCYVKAYEYCINKYNLYKEVFVHGASMGGISSTNVVLSGKIPIIAQTGFCPVLDTYNQIFLHPWTGGLPKTALGVLYNLDKDDNGQYVYDEEKILGFNPSGKIRRANDDIEILDYPVAIKFWLSLDDPIVNPNCTARFVNAINNNNGSAELVIFPSGGHEPHCFGEDVLSPIGNVIFNGEKLSITPATEGVFEFIKKYE